MLGLRSLLPLILCCLLSSCYRLSVQAFGTESILLNQEGILKGQDYSVLRRFYREQQLEYVFGYNEYEARALEQILQQETAGRSGVGVINLRIQRTYRPVDAIVALLTLGVFTRSLLIVEGDVIIWHASDS